MNMFFLNKKVIRIFIGAVYATMLLGCGVVGAVVKSTLMLNLPAYSDRVRSIKNKLEKKRAMQAEFKELIALLCMKHSEKQLAVPEKSHKDIIRVATYNVHRWRGPEKGINDTIGTSFMDIVDVIKSTNADVLIAQEAEVRSPQTLAILSALGYRYSAFAGAFNENAQYGNMIVSKLPFTATSIKKNFSYEGHHPRSFVKIELDLSKYGKKNLVIYGTHFDDQTGKARLLEAQELVDLVRKYDQGKNVIIGADFNEQTGVAIKYLASQGFMNSFDLAGIDQPKFTQWSKKVTDGFYMQKKDLNVWIDGSYLSYTAASNHVPVIVDIDPTK